MRDIQYICELNKENLNKPSDVDQIYYSELREWFTNNAFRSLSIKYVLEGTISYKAEGEEFRVPGNHFLLATKQPDVKAYFKNPVTTKSLCIDICEHSLNEAFTVLSYEKKGELSDYNPSLMKAPHFVENIYPTGLNSIGGKLELLSANLLDVVEGELPISNIHINREWFLEMVELIILNEFKNYKFLNSLSALKNSTRKEILKRLTTGKNFIDQSFKKNPDIKTIARESNMSEFHFFRCFKKVFGDTPYQYLLNKRLAYAKDLLNDRDLLMSKIAVECGFPDVFTFSKAFKRRYGFSPTKSLPHELSTNKPDTD